MMVWALHMRIATILNTSLEFSITLNKLIGKACNEHRPGLTDCGALGKIILGGPQIKVKNKKKKKKKGHSHFLQPFHTNQQYSLQQNNLGRLQCSTRLDDRLFN